MNPYAQAPCVSRGSVLFVSAGLNAFSSSSSGALSMRRSSLMLSR